MRTCLFQTQKHGDTEFYLCIFLELKILLSVSLCLCVRFSLPNFFPSSLDNHSLGGIAYLATAEVVDAVIAVAAQLVIRNGDALYASDVLVVVGEDEGTNCRT